MSDMAIGAAGEVLTLSNGTRVERLALPEVLLITPLRRADDRGWFAETYSAAALAEAGVRLSFVQDNHAASLRRGAVRGLHFQRPPHAQAKLVRAACGAIWDVALDIRPGSAGFGRWVAAELSGEDGRQLLVPAGFAHGYACLRDGCEVLYKVDAPYAPEAEGGVRWDDPALAIPWPIAPNEAILHPRDRLWPTLAEVAAAEGAG